MRTRRTDPSPLPANPGRRTFMHRGGAIVGALLVGPACDDERESSTEPTSDAASDLDSDAGAVDVDPRPDAGADAGTDVVADVASDAGPTAGRWPACEAGASTQTVSFVHVNDIHGAYTPHPEHGSPVARIRGFYLQTLAENPFTVFTNAGDDYEKGSVAEQMSEGRATLEITRGLGFDVRCIGNHDFCWSLDQLLEFTHDPRAATLLSNVTYTGPNPERFAAQDFVKLEVGCVTIGFFGMVSKAWNERNQQIDGPFYAELPMRVDYVARAQELIDLHRAEVDILVMVSHLGLGDDVLVASGTTGIDFILGGHSHSVRSREQVVGATTIIQAGSSAGFIARLDVEVDLVARSIRSYRYALTPNLPVAVPADPAVDALVEDVFARLAPRAQEPVGRLAQSRGGVELAGLAAQSVVGLDLAAVAIGDEWTVWDSLPSGLVTPQDFVDGFKVERQPAGTPGFNSWYRVLMAGPTLQSLIEGLPAGWRVAGTFDPSAAEVAVAVQKHIAFNPGVYLDRTSLLGTPEPLGEAWDLLDRYAQMRTLSCLHVDTDEALETCDG